MQLVDTREGTLKTSHKILYFLMAEKSKFGILWVRTCNFKANLIMLTNL
jgi:hypothetical protein